MGNANLIDLEKDWDWGFVGRENDLNKLLLLVNNNGLVEIFGILQIGKSRLLGRLISELLKNQTKRILFFDYHLYRGAAWKGLVKSLKEAFYTLNKALKTPLETLDEATISEVTLEFIDMVKNNKEEVIICLDNLQVVCAAEKEKQKLLAFMKNVVSRTQVKVIVTTNDKIGFTGRRFASYELGPLCEKDILELIHTMTDDKLRDDDVYMPVIAKLCEGLPIAAMVTACELNDDEGFIKPSDMVETLIKDRISTLSSDIYPEEEKLDNYKKPIEEIKLGPYLFHVLKQWAKNTTGTAITVDEAVQARGEARVTGADAKKDARKLHRKGALGTLRDDKIHLHGVIRECALFLDLETPFDHLPDADKEKYKEIFHQAMKENVARANLDINDEILNNPRELAAYLKALDPSTGKKAVENDDTPSSSLNDLNETKTGLSLPYQSNADSSVSSTSDNLDSMFSGLSSESSSGISDQPIIYRHSGVSRADRWESNMLNSPTECLRWNIPSDAATGNNTQEPQPRRVSSELNDETYSSASGPPAMSYKNESLTDTLNNETCSSGSGPPAISYKSESKTKIENG